MPNNRKTVNNGVHFKLLQRGDATRPTTYQFGANEELHLHNDANKTIELCALGTGAHIRSLDASYLRAMGYDAAKLLRGERVDQFVSKEVSCG